MARPWRSHVDFACSDCGLLLRDCTDHGDPGRACVACGNPTRLIGIGGPVVGNARWFRCPGCGQLHMLRRGEFVKTGERAGTEEFGGLS